MKPEYLSQVVYCSTHDKRAFLREVAVTPTDAAVTRVEILPPGYEHAMSPMRHPHEPVHVFRGMLKAFSNYQGCPYCGNVLTYECGTCGALSCISRDFRRHHTCPVCGTIAETELAGHFVASESGFTGNRLPNLPWNGGGDPASPRVARPTGGQVERNYDWARKDFTEVMRHPSRDFSEAPPPQPPSVTMDQMLNAPPPVRGLLGSGDADEQERLRKALKKRFFKK
jgi:hypothetical protein